MNSTFCSRRCEVEGSVQGQQGQWHLCQVLNMLNMISGQLHKSVGAHSRCD